MTDFRIESTRSSLVESVHQVSVAVVDPSGSLVAESGDPSLVTFWRSAAKPFQAMALVEDGAADAYGFGAEELALACASHSSEPMHLAVARRMLERSGSVESDLACGPHTPLGAAVAAEVARNGTPLTPIWSNCSGKHAGMLALARHHRWPVTGYEREGHRVQQRIADEVSRWTGVRRDDLRFGVDGCTTVCFALPLRAMAAAYARFGGTTEPEAARLRTAMTGHPSLVAGTGRLCTELMLAWPEQVIAKIGADGVYSAALPAMGLGLAVKIHGGDMRAASVALLGVLAQVLDRLAPRVAATGPLDALAAFAEPAIRNTRGEITGVVRAAGTLRFHC